MFRHAYLEMVLALAGACALGGCCTARRERPARGCSRASSDQPAATFSVPAAALHLPLVLIAYGDMRFTNPAETSATSPSARRALVAKVAAERPQAIFLNGDVPWHGISADYDVYPHRNGAMARTAIARLSRTRQSLTAWISVLG
jgi:hypothetical protein